MSKKKIKAVIVDHLNVFTPFQIKQIRNKYRLHQTRINTDNITDTLNSLKKEKNFEVPKYFHMYFVSVLKNWII